GRAVAGARKVVERSATLEDSALVREIALRVVAASDKQPLTNASAALYVVNDTSSFSFGESQMDGGGRSRFPYPPQETTALRFLVRAPGFVSVLRTVSRDGASGMPAEITVELTPGARIGGIVRGRQGEPVVGAEVILSTISNASPSHVIQTGLESLRTDAQ